MQSAPRLDVSDEALLHEAEWRLCAEDREYFARKYLKITVPKRGKIALHFRDAQSEFLTQIDETERVIVLKARQIGYTTAAVAYAFHDSFFNSDHPWLLVSTGEGPAKKTLRKVRIMFNGLPLWMKERGPQLVTDSMESMAWDNDSRIDSLPSTAASGRGDAVYGVIFDEAAFMQDAGSVYGALEPMTYGPLVVISTAHGMGNWFHDRWLDSQLDDSAWTPLFYPWSAVPDRDEEWYRTTALKYRGQEWLFYQEYPANPTEAFAKSGRPAIDPDLLEDQDYYPAPKRFNYDPFSETWHPWTEVEDHDITLHVWEEPTVERDENDRMKQLPNYVLFCDTAEGLEHGDYTAVTVWNANTDEMVATMQTRIPLDELGEMLASLGWWYHSALIGVERNNHGMVPLIYLQKHARYPRLFRMPKLAMQIRDESRRLDYGWLTSTKTKPKMVIDFIKGLRDQHITIHEQRFLVESSTFVADGRGGYNATKGNHDDLVIATLGGWQMVLDVDRYPSIYFDDGPHRTTMGELISLTSNYPDGGTHFLDTAFDEQTDNPVLVAVDWPETS